MKEYIKESLKEYYFEKKEQAEDIGARFSFDRFVADFDTEYFIRAYLCYNPKFKIEVLKNILEAKEEEL